MKPVDYRNECFIEVKARVTGDRLHVLEAWKTHGPCTTEELAALSGISILTLRPRTTELFQLGMVRIVEDSEPMDATAHGERSGGVYRAASEFEARRLFENERAEALQTQLSLKV